VSIGLGCVVLLGGCEFSDTTWSDGVVVAYDDWLPARQAVNGDCAPRLDAPKDVELCISALKELEDQNTAYLSAIELKNHRLAVSQRGRKECAGDLKNASLHSATLRTALMSDSLPDAQLAAARLDASHRSSFCTFVEAAAENDALGAFSIFRRLADSRLVWLYACVAAVLFAVMEIRDRVALAKLKATNANHGHGSLHARSATAGVSGNPAATSTQDPRPPHAATPTASGSVPPRRGQMSLRVLWARVVTVSTALDVRYQRVHKWVVAVASLVLAVPVTWLLQSLF
jgi:hypothetical protein